jgi:molybdate transport system ATP-binding protein
MLLLDEPLSALDATLRAEFRRDLDSQLRSFDGVRVLVTHDPLEAMALGDNVVVIEDGRVTQSGSPAEVAARPRTPYVAQLVGVNLMRGRGKGAQVSLEKGGSVEVATDCAGDVFAVVHPSAVAIHRSLPEGTPRNVWAAHIDGVERLGPTVWVRASATLRDRDDPLRVIAQVTAASAEELALVPGCNVWLSVKATEVGVYPA